MFAKNVILVKENNDSIDAFIEAFPITSYPEYMLKQVLENLNDIFMIKEPSVTVLFENDVRSIFNNIALTFSNEFASAEYLVVVNGDNIVAVDINDIVSLSEVLCVDKIPSESLIDTIKKECKMIVDLDKL